MKRSELLEKMRIEFQNIQNFDTNDIKSVICEVLRLNTKEYLLKSDFSDDEIGILQKVVEKLKKNVPLDKILGRKCFYGRDFVTNENVLSPRKETELLVEQSLKYLSNFKEKPRVLDLCCGSGCIGLTISCETQNEAEVVLTDISNMALSVAKENGKKLGLKNVKFVLGDMFEGLKSDDKFDIIISNPPYIETSIIETLDPQVKDHDPRLSLDGGEDGLKFYRQISSEAEQYLNENGFILMEIGCNQGVAVQNIFRAAGYNTQVIKDYSQCDRVVVATKNKK